MVTFYININIYSLGILRYCIGVQALTVYAAYPNSISVAWMVPCQECSLNTEPLVRLENIWIASQTNTTKNKSKLCFRCTMLVNLTTT